MMSLRHIEVFHAVYVSGSVIGAARMLNVSQPSVTKVLQHAESVLGFPLFERRSGRLVATEDAHSLFSEVADVIERVTSLRKASVNMRFGRTGTIRVSALPSLCLGVVPDAVSAFLKTHSNVSFDLQTVYHQDMMRVLYDRETEIVISYDVPKSMPIASQQIGKSELVLLYRKSDFPALLERVALKDVSERPFIALSRSGPIGAFLTAELKRQDLAMNEVASARTIFIAAALVRSGVGIAVVDLYTARSMAGSDMAFCPLDPPIALTVNAVNLQSRPPSRVMATFLKAVAAELKGYSPAL